MQIFRKSLFKRRFMWNMISMKREILTMKSIILISIILVAAIAAGCSDNGTPPESTPVQNGKNEYVYIESASASSVSEKVANYINSYLIQDGDVTISSVEDKGTIYLVNTEFQGSEVPLYVSKDGNYLFLPNCMWNTSDATDSEDLQEFVDCLGKSGFKIYGATWCTYCQQLVGNLGGYEAVEGIYVECTENEELCEQEGVSSYPTIKINGEVFEKQRTFENFSEATGCPVPKKLGSSGMLNKEQAKDRIMNYINSYIVEPGTVANASSVDEEGALYKINTSYQGIEVPVYTTKDGVYMFNGRENICMYDLNKEPVIETPTPQPTATPLSVSTPEASEESLREFVNCLNDSGFKIYGAKWCGYCQKLVGLLGGYEIVEPIYVECTEQASVCQQEGVSAYPTIKINGERYQGERSYQAFSQATGCPVPE